MAQDSSNRKPPAAQTDVTGDLELEGFDDMEITDPAIRKPASSPAPPPPSARQKPPAPAPGPAPRPKTSGLPQQQAPKPGGPVSPGPSAPRPATVLRAPEKPAASPTPAAVPVRTPAPARMPEMGPLEALMKDPEITEIMVNDLRNVMVEKSGKLMSAGFSIQAIEDLNRITRSILDTTGRILSPDQPYLDTMLPDGSRVNIVAPPLTLFGPCITIRKFSSHHLTVDDLLKYQMLDRRIAYFLNACVVGRLNILVSGGTGTGKTTLLNVLASMIPQHERIVTIEDTPELNITHVNHVRMQTKPQMPASPPIHARELVANALRMRPDRIIVGESRRAEAFDILQAMNTGHEGSMTTIHANTPRDALTRMETLCLMAGLEIPMNAIRKQIQGAIDLIVQIKRFRDGARRIVAVVEVTGMEGDTVTLQDIYTFEPDNRNPNTPGSGRFKCTGFVPTFVERLRDYGIEFPPNYFSD